MNKINNDMEMWKTLSKAHRKRLGQLLDKKETQTLTEEEAEEYCRLIKEALVLSCLRWGV